MTTYSHAEHSTDFEPTEPYRELRDQCPLHRETSHDPPFYVLSRFADIVDALKQPSLWTNGDGPGVFFQENGVLGTTDEPDHSRHRHVLRSAFLPSTIARMEPALTGIATSLFDQFVPLGETDFVEQFAFPFPALAIGELLGVPAEDREMFRAWSLAAVDALTGHDVPGYRTASAALGSYIDSQVTAREVLLDAADLAPDEDPRGTVLTDDVLTTMLLALRAGTLVRAEVTHLGSQLLVAGHETTTSLLGMMLYRLIERPDVLARLRADRRLLPQAIEEALRFDSPVHGLFRTNAEPTTLHDTTIPQGTKMQLLYASANRDPAQFEDPDEFRIDRDRHELGRHIAFGWGIHHCIGAPLARLETRIAFEQILDRMDDIELAGEATRNDSFVLHGLTSLPIRWTPR